MIKVSLELVLKEVGCLVKREVTKGKTLVQNMFSRFPLPSDPATTCKGPSIFTLT